MTLSFPSTQVGINRANNKVCKGVDFVNSFVEIARAAFVIYAPNRSALTKNTLM